MADKVDKGKRDADMAAQSQAQTKEKSKADKDKDKNKEDEDKKKKTMDLFGQEIEDAEGVRKLRDYLGKFPGREDAEEIAYIARDFPAEQEAILMVVQVELGNDWVARVLELLEFWAENDGFQEETVAPPEAEEFER